MLPEFKSLDAVLHDIKKLQEAYKILEKIYIDIGPYSRNEVSRETLLSMNNFFEFDDSE